MCYGEYFPNPGSLAEGNRQYSKGQHELQAMLVSPQSAFAAELLGTMILGFMVFAVTDPRNPGRPVNYLAPVVIGLTVAALISIIGPLTQACFNPARDFGPRLFACFAGWGPIAIPWLEDWNWLTVYIVAPTIGASLGGALYNLIVRRAASHHGGRVRVNRHLRVGSPVDGLIGLAASHSSVSRPADADSPDVHQPYSAERSQPVTHDVEFVVTVTAPYQTKLLRVWLPIPPSDHASSCSSRASRRFPKRSSRR